MATRQITEKIFNDAIKVIVKNFGKGYAQRGLAKSDYKGILTGHDDLDDVLTHGARGVYLGGVIEVCGPESSGKTSFALRVCGNALKAGMHCCWLDAEASFDPNLAVINGCDPTKLMIPDLTETKAIKGEKKSEEDKEEDNAQIGFLNINEVLEMAYQSIIQNVYGVVVLDSVAGLMPESILIDDLDPNKAGMAEVARAMSRFLPKIAQACKRTETTLILINQLRDKPGDYYASRFHTPGGRAVKFFCQQRLGIERVGGEDGKVSIDEDGSKVVIGHYARVHIIKNKKASPLQEHVKIEVPIYYREYFPDMTKRIYDLARRLQVITMRSGVMTWKSGDEIVLKLEGESAVLAKIKCEQWEARLAHECVLASKSQKNQDLKMPIKVPSTIADLASSYKSEPESTDKPVPGDSASSDAESKQLKDKKKKMTVPTL